MWFPCPGVSETQYLRRDGTLNEKELNNPPITERRVIQLKSFCMSHIAYMHYPPIYRLSVNILNRWERGGCTNPTTYCRYESLPTEIPGVIYGCIVRLCKVELSFVIIWFKGLSKARKLQWRSLFSVIQDMSGRSGLLRLLK